MFAMSVLQHLAKKETVVRDTLRHPHLATIYGRYNIICYKNIYSLLYYFKVWV